MEKINLPLVSVIITTRNRLDLLQRAVKSVINQTYTNIELIVVDDGSEDGTEDWCNNQKFKYLRIPKYESRGGNYARNLGINSSSGDFLAFLDDDDYWLPEKIKKQYQLFSQKRHGVIYTLRQFVNANTSNKFDEVFNQELEGNIRFKTFYNGGFTSTSTLFIPRSYIYAIGLWDENLAVWQDNDLIIRLSQKYMFYCVKEHLTCYWIDNKETAKLSNKYYDWKKSVKYLKEKHQHTIKQMSFLQKRELLIFITKTAYLKSNLANVKLAALKSLLLFSIIAPIRLISILFKTITRNKNH